MFHTTAVYHSQLANVSYNTCYCYFYANTNNRDIPFSMLLHVDICKFALKLLAS